MTFKMESTDMCHMDWLYGTVAAALEQRFGKPSKIESSLVQNAFGAGFNNETRIWTNKTGNIRIRRFEDNLNTMMLRYWVTDYVNYHNDRLAEEQAKSPPKL